MQRNHRYPSASYSSLNATVRCSWRSIPLPVTGGVFRRYRGRSSQDAQNLDQTSTWEWTAATIAQELIPYVTLLNDLAANAYGISQLVPSTFAIIQGGDPEAEGNRCVVSPGTGLGEAGLFGTGAGIMPGLARGGIRISPPATILEIALLEYLIKHYGHVNNERVVPAWGLKISTTSCVTPVARRVAAEDRPRNEGRRCRQHHFPSRPEWDVPDVPP